MSTATSYTLSTTADPSLGFDETVECVRAELKEEGFGVLCEIDVQATLRARLGAELEPYVILGACNPRLAHQALSAEAELGALLPCNVVVYERGSATHVSAVDPISMLGIVDHPQLSPVADEIRGKVASIEVGVEGISEAE